jgi:hypothetical protein
MTNSDESQRKTGDQQVRGYRGKDRGRGIPAPVGLQFFALSVEAADWNNDAQGLTVVQCTVNSSIRPTCELNKARVEIE